MIDYCNLQRQIYKLSFTIQVVQSVIYHVNFTIAINNIKFTVLYFKLKNFSM